MARSTLEFPPPMDLAVMAQNWSAYYALVMVGMWWSMMMAMMLPGTILQSHSQWSFTGQSVGFFVQYALVWLAFSVTATALQYCLERLDLLHGMRMWSIDETLSIALLLVAGTYQFLPMKRAAIRHCNATVNLAATPMSGLRYGGHCLIATTPLMLLLYVGGAMNLYWIIGLSGVVTIEKWRPEVVAFTNLAGVTCFLMAVSI